MFRIYDYSDKVHSSKIQKIYIKGTRVVGLKTQNFIQDKALWIDVFLFENCPKNKFARKVRGTYHDLLSSAISYKRLYKHPSKLILEKCKEHKDMSKWYKTRRFAGFFTNIFPKNFYLKQIKRLERYKKETGLICIPSAKKYESEVFPKETFYETVPCKFRDIELMIPKEYDKYMRNIYGDYMQVPPPEKRERHLGIELNLNYKENE